MTCTEIALKCQKDQRFVKELLAALVCGDIVDCEHDKETNELMYSVDQEKLKM